jgi:hypothetical protein
MSRDRSTLAFLMKMLAALAVAGCASSTAIRTFEDRQPRAVVGEPRLVMFRKLVSLIPEGTPLGTIQRGLFCLPQGHMIWQRPRGAKIDAEVVLAALTSELSKAGYKVIGAPESLFDEHSESQAEFLLAGSVTYVASNECHQVGKSSAETSVEIEWQVFEQRARAVVLTITTGGTSREPLRPRGAQLAFAGAFAAALRNLLADERFAALMSR